MADLAGVQLEHDAFLYGSDEQAGHGDGAVPAGGPDPVGTRPSPSRHRATSGCSAIGWAPTRRSATSKPPTGYARPAAAIAQYDAAIRQLIDGGAPHLRVAGELPFGSTAGEHASWSRYEAIVNKAFERAPLWVVCLYDTRCAP